MKKKRATTVAVSLHEEVHVRVRKTQGRFEKIRNPKGRDEAVGEFFLEVELNTRAGDTYVPLSIASGKKPTGFVYHIEGSGKSALSSATVTCEGKGVAQVTLGTLVYAHIPAGTRASFRVLVTMKGFVNESYTVVIDRMHYKHDLHEARYQKADVALHSKTLLFR